MTASYNNAIKYAKLCKELGCITIFGGPHASATAESTIMNPYIDVVIFGEGEITLYELVKRINSNVSIVGTDGIVYKFRNSAFKEDRRERINDLDSLPMPDYESFNLANYIELEALGVMTSRGCANNCSFCASKCTWERKVKFRSPENIILELDYLCEKFQYRSKQLLFYDDNFTADIGRLYRLCKQMKEKNYDFKWKCMSRVSSISEEILIAMKEAGCHTISFGIESAVENSLKNMRKQISLQEVEKAIKLCVNAGIHVVGYFIIGFPWETKKDFNTTIDFIINHPEMESALNFLTPYPGTTFYDDAEKWGLKISDEWDKYTNLSVVMESESYTRQDLYDAYTRYLIFNRGKTT
jgi:radical SAM superfamily enzyme YgiQ (UPF0313 family)